jgi:hypothetical protein
MNTPFHKVVIIIYSSVINRTTDLIDGAVPYFSCNSGVVAAADILGLIFVLPAKVFRKNNLIVV